MSQPLIDSARLQFSGLSAEDFEDVPEIGEERVYTIRARCQSHTEREMANEGTRKSVNMKVTRVLSGVANEIDDEPEPEPSLFDSDDTSSVDAEPESIGSILGGAEAFQGPTFSAGDE
ncbi:hypothetical protein C8K38_111224 [Rhodococcus sp. OK611]|uniref:DUF7171 family protein n=1 Tax=unclassified Rhodococcus (in: high G+C Gram-positive bacteria) TaxID=192944 RepID=UPI000BD0F44A|nr:MULTISPECIES: hypothetical protein [unclassified Rhodococcus (in: high G+C Gram-positive bacteria)]PTR42055.1 hypothetical protein C8K38_111224 [Rhodococcus sp. OK611]SNX91498.1 hypothetical protein SAMN05447004_11033 [Rhodococcus sp. OK270]